MVLIEYKSFLLAAWNSFENGPVRGNDLQTFIYKGREAFFWTEMSFFVSIIMFEYIFYC